MVIVTNVTSIGCVYKEKVLKMTHTVASTQIQKVAIFDSDRK